MTPQYVVVFFWFAWLLSWGFAANLGPSSDVAKHAGMRREWPYRALQISGFVLLFVSLGQSYSADPLSPVRRAVLDFGFAQLWELPAAALWGAAVLAAVGFGLAWWARLHLGGLWSSGVTRKQDHKLIDSGPYAFVRHPIYTGMLLSSIALLAISGRMFGLIGFLCVVAGMILKARLEEKFLAEELGPDIYGAYAKRVPMLVPGLRV